MISCDLLRTDAQIAQLLGEVCEKSGYSVVRTPDNPGFYFGNFLILEEPPKDLARWNRVFEETFGPQVKHRCFSWAAGEPQGDLPSEFAQLGFEHETTAELRLLPTDLWVDLADQRWTIRPLHAERDWEACAALSRACDSTAADAGDDYRLFAERQRANRREWLKRGMATWWGAFHGHELVGQCGLVPCGDVGRFQTVETHPEWRRRGICTALISRVADDAFRRSPIERLVLGAEIDGPAIALYHRIGFKTNRRVHSLVRHPDPMRVRDEALADRAGVRSLTQAAFRSPHESALIEELRLSPGSISLVAERSNSLLGHILFSKLRLEDKKAEPHAVALAPLAVRPAAQGRGVGQALVRAGLERCRCDGHRVCVVIGSPGYYARFGFRPAAAEGLSNPFGVDDEHFMALELIPGALRDCSGHLIYDRAFDKLS